MMKGCRKFQDKIGLYYYGELSDREKQSLEEHASICKDCAAQIHDVKVILDIVSTKEIPDQSPEFWADYDATLKEKLSAKNKLENRTHNFIPGIFYGIKEYLLPDFQRSFHPAFSAIVVILLLGAAVFLGYNTKDIETGPFPAKQPQIAQTPANEETIQEKSIESEITKDIEPVKTAIPETRIAMTDLIEEKKPTPVEQLFTENTESALIQSEQTIVIGGVDDNLKNVSPVTEKEPTGIKKEQAQPIMLANTSAKVQPIKPESISSVPGIEDELILQKLVLLLELGEDIDLQLNNEDIIKDIALIKEISAS